MIKPTYEIGNPGAVDCKFYCGDMCKILVVMTCRCPSKVCSFYAERGVENLFKEEKGGKINE
jgi:hypothetical protein